MDPSEVTTLHQCVVCNDIFEKYQDLLQHNETHVKTEKNVDDLKTEEPMIDDNVTDDVQLFRYYYGQPKNQEVKSEIEKTITGTCEKSEVVNEGEVKFDNDAAAEDQPDVKILKLDIKKENVDSGLKLEPCEIKPENIDNSFPIQHKEVLEIKTEREGTEFLSSKYSDEIKRNDVSIPASEISNSDHEKEKRDDLVKKFLPTVQKIKIIVKQKKVDKVKMFYRCNMCENVYEQNKEFKKHVLTHQTKRNIFNKEKSHMPPTSNLVTLKDDSVSQTGETSTEHGSSNCVSTQTLETEAKDKKDTQQPKNLLDRLLICRECGLKCDNIFQLQRHEKLHTQKKLFECYICYKPFTCFSAMETHVRTHTKEKPYSCTYCSKAFGTKGQLQAHTRTHTGEKPFSCLYCGKTFVTSSNQQKHVRIHTGEKPYICGTCNKSFSNSGDLRRHVRCHTGEKPYHCNICQKVFAQRSNLKKHAKVHTGEKPHECDICNRSFSQRSNLVKHVRTHDEKPSSSSYDTSSMSNLSVDSFSDHSQSGKDSDDDISYDDNEVESSDETHIKVKDKPIDISTEWDNEPCVKENDGDSLGNMNVGSNMDMDGRFTVDNDIKSGIKEEPVESKDTECHTEGKHDRLFKHAEGKYVGLSKHTEGHNVGLPKHTESKAGGLSKHVSPSEIQDVCSSTPVESKDAATCTYSKEVVLLKGRRAIYELTPI